MSAATATAPARQWQRVLLLAALAAAAGALSAQTPRLAPFDLEEATVADLQQRMADGGETSRSVVEKYLTRIDEIDRRGPELRSVLEINPDARSIADAMDAERRAGHLRGRLHGIPVQIKDNIATADRMMTTAGSLALAGAPAPRDAFIVERLRAGGAVILGKTNLSEWANFRSTHSSSGWSARGGQTRNPYALDRNPSGSSSGSGVAVAASLCAAAVGTETDGSIISPSSINGIVGIKPSVGLIPGEGVVPISHRQDTAGPMARTVEDAALLLSALASAAYGRALDRNGLRGARIGVARQIFGFNDHVDRLMEGALTLLKQQGAVLIDPATISTYSKLNEPENEALQWEFKEDLNAYLAARGGAVKSLRDVIEFNTKNPDREMPYFAQDIMVKAEARGPLSSRAYRDLVSKLGHLVRQDGLDKTLNDLKLDALVAPSDGPAWPIDYINGDHFSGGAS